MTEQERIDVLAAWEADPECRPQFPPWGAMTKADLERGKRTLIHNAVHHALHTRLLALGAFVYPDGSETFAVGKSDGEADWSIVVECKDTSISAMARAIVALRSKQ